jgi:sortase A
MIVRIRSGAWRIAQRLFLVAGILALSFVAYSYVAGSGYQAYQSWKLDRALAHSPEQAAGSVSGPSSIGPAHGPLTGRIAIPRLKISAIVKEGVGNRMLGLAVGHIPSTAMPGRPGNVGLAAHRDRLFRKLKDIREDDEITLTTLHGTYIYRVVWFKVVSPTAVSVLQPSDGEETLTLVTCYPFYFVGHAPKRFIVRARQVASIQPPQPL